MTTSPALAAAPAAVTLLDPTTVLGAASDPARYAILRALGDGTPRSVAELARAVGKSPDAVSKHLRVLREARLICAVTPAGVDGRQQHHVVPEPFRGRDAAGKTVLDFGAVVLRLD